MQPAYALQKWKVRLEQMHCRWLVRQRAILRKAFLQVQFDDRSSLRELTRREEVLWDGNCPLRVAQTGLRFEGRSHRGFIICIYARALWQRKRVVALIVIYSQQYCCKKALRRKSTKAVEKPFDEYKILKGIKLKSRTIVPAPSHLFPVVHLPLLPTFNVSRKEIYWLTPNLKS